MIELILKYTFKTHQDFLNGFKGMEPEISVVDVKEKKPVQQKQPESVDQWAVKFKQEPWPQIQPIGVPPPVIPKKKLKEKKRMGCRPGKRRQGLPQAWLERANEAIMKFEAFTLGDIHQGEGGQYDHIKLMKYLKAQADVIAYKELVPLRAAGRRGGANYQWVFYPVKTIDGVEQIAPKPAPPSTNYIKAAPLRREQHKPAYVKPQDYWDELGIQMDKTVKDHI